jgi:DNA repair exonuclease SbcCD nuclease subunit
MKFAHLADIHIGGWREEKLKDLTIQAFNKAMDYCIDKNVGFILICGDLFNTSLPAIELLKDTAEILQKVRNNDISIYIVPGSHDFSPSGKTMLDVLEKAGLVENVFKVKNNNLVFTIDKTNTKITGILGRKGALEKYDYLNLNFNNLEKESGFKIFMLHTAIEEFKPQELEKVEALNLNNLPKNFNYYAGGHVHYIFNKKQDNSLIAYPGALFPNNFQELEKFKHGGFYIVDDKLNLEYINIKLKDVVSYSIDANDKTPQEIEKELLGINNFEDKIITIRIEGVLKEGKVSDINFNKIIEHFENAYFVLKNTNKLNSKEFEELNIESGNIEDIEDKIIQEYLEKNKTFDNEENMIFDMINILNKEKEEGEKNIDFENRIIKDFRKIVEI